MISSWRALGCAVVLSACGGSVESTPAGGGGATAASSSPSSAAETSSASTATSSATASSSAAASASASSSASASTGGGAACGGKGGASCSPDEYCDYTPSTCGVFDGGGVCTKKPQVCDQVYAPACGCDGLVHDNACGANGAGVDLNDNGTCPPPSADLFPCGHAFCTLATQYCEVVHSTVGGDDAFTCKSLPPECAAQVACGCLANVSCGMFCAGDAASGLTATCPMK